MYGFICIHLMLQRYSNLVFLPSVLTASLRVAAIYILSRLNGKDGLALLAPERAAIGTYTLFTY